LYLSAAGYKEVGGQLAYPLCFPGLCGDPAIRESGAEPKCELQIFWSYRVWEAQKEQIIANVIMFLPIGLTAGAVFGWKSILLGFGLSAVIESLQLVTYRGLFEFDDIHNTLGAAIGFFILLSLRRIKHGNDH
jgi:glycopeptide antibiotics resistance protein